jgi:hypothetical protein
MADSNSSLGKWVGGIIGTVLAGVLLWWLTGPLSPFVNRVEPPPKTGGDTYTPTKQGPDPVVPVEQKAEVVISGFNLKSPINIGTYTTCDFEVTNRGNQAANGCQLIWDTPGLNGSKTSDQFNLAPGEKKNFQLVSNTFDKEGTYVTKAHLSCSNTSQVEDTRSLVVNFMMQARPSQ